MPIYPPRDRSEDIRLADALRKRRPGAAGRLYDAYGPRLHGYAEGLLGDGEPAAQAVRGAMLAMRARSAEVPDIDRFQAWLYASVREECLKRLGGRDPQERQSPPKGTSGDGRAGFRFELETSNELEREAAELAIDHGLSNADVAYVLGVSLDRVAELQGRVKVTFSGPLRFKPRGPQTRERATNVIKGPWARRNDPAERPPPKKGTRPVVGPPPKSGGAHRTADSSRRERMRGARTTGAAAAFAACGLVVFLTVLLTSGPPHQHAKRSPQLAAPGSRVTTPAGSGPVTPGLPGATPSVPGQPPGTGQPPGNPGDPSNPGNPSNPAGPPGPGPANPPSTKKPAAPKPPPVRTTGRLAISDSGCQRVTAHTPRSCQITLTAVGGAVRWAVSSVNSSLAKMSASGAGTLSSGRSTSVTVTVSPTVGCYARGFGNGTVGFSPGGVASISYKCW